MTLSITSSTRSRRHFYRQPLPVLAATITRWMRCRRRITTACLEFFAVRVRYSTRSICLMSIRVRSIRFARSRFIFEALVQQWRQDLMTLDAAWLTSAVTALGDKAPEMTDPLFVWHRLLASQSESGQKYADTWLGVSAECESEIKRRAAFNAENFVTIADFRKTLPEGWITTGMGLREGVCAAGNFLPADDGDSAIRRILPAGLHTSTISEKLNALFVRQRFYERKQKSALK